MLITPTLLSKELREAPGFKPGRESAIILVNVVSELLFSCFHRRGDDHQ